MRNVVNKIAGSSWKGLLQCSSFTVYGLLWSSSLQCLRERSPWCDLCGWLGVKKQLSILCERSMVSLLCERSMVNISHNSISSLLFPSISQKPVKLSNLTRWLPRSWECITYQFLVAFILNYGHTSMQLFHGVWVHMVQQYSVLAWEVALMWPLWLTGR